MTRASHARAAVASLLLGLAAAGPPLPSSWPTTTTVSALGGPGAPSMSTLFFSYASNFQLNATTAPSNLNFNVLRACLRRRGAWAGPAARGGPQLL